MQVLFFLLFFCIDVFLGYAHIFILSDEFENHYALGILIGMVLNLEINLGRFTL